MAKKKPSNVEGFPDDTKAPGGTADLGLTGKGVEELKIPDIDKAINKYERKKEARCKMSPEEISAKTALKDLLHENRAKLPLNEDGEHFYRYDGVDYVLKESLRRRKVDEGGDE